MCLFFAGSLRGCSLFRNLFLFSESLVFKIGQLVNKMSNRIFAATFFIIYVLGGFLKCWDAKLMIPLSLFNLHRYILHHTNP